MAYTDTVVSVAEDNLPLLVAETGVLVTPVAFTEDTADEVENLVITPRGPCHKMVLIINEVSDGGDLTVNCKAGSFWAAQEMTEVTVASGTSKAFVFESAKHYGNEAEGGTDADEAKIQISVAPDTGLQLVTTHGATWQVFQLP